jgi:hypothetical protein
MLVEVCVGSLVFGERISSLADVVTGAAGSGVVNVLPADEHDRLSVVMSSASAY